MFPGVGVVVGGVRLAVGSHDSSDDDDDGATWTIGVGDTIIVDIPDSYTPYNNPAIAPLAGLSTRQETATVMSVAFPAPMTGSGLPSPAGTGGNVVLQLAVGNKHFRGCIMQLNPASVTTTGNPGNPGPQPSFNYKDTRFSGVVPFATIITSP